MQQGIEILSLLLYNVQAPILIKQSKQTVQIGSVTVQSKKLIKNFHWHNLSDIIYNGEYIIVLSLR